MRGWWPANILLKHLLGGERAVVKLCKGSAHRLNAPVVFTARGQTLTTEDNPLGLDRAMLVVEGEKQSTAISCVSSQCIA